MPYPKKVGICVYCKKDIIAKNAGFDKPNRKFCSYCCKLSQQNKDRVWTKEQRDRVAKINKIHGMSHHPLHHVWDTMKARCYRPKHASFKNYGGRGIKVCKEWHTAKNFIDWGLKNGYQHGLYLDRIDNNKDYSPVNCQWVTAKESVNNRKPRSEWHRPKQKINKQKAKEMYLNGKTFLEIAIALDCSATWAHKIITKPKILNK